MRRITNFSKPRPVEGRKHDQIAHTSSSTESSRSRPSSSFSLRARLIQGQKVNQHQNNTNHNPSTPWTSQAKRKTSALFSRSFTFMSNRTKSTERALITFSSSFFSSSLPSLPQKRRNQKLKSRQNGFLDSTNNNTPNSFNFGFNFPMMVNMSNNTNMVSQHNDKGNKMETVVLGGILKYAETVFEDKFIDSLESSLLTEFPEFLIQPGVWEERKKEISIEAKHIFNENQELIVDDASKAHLFVCSIVIGSYYSLRRHIPQNQLLDILSRNFAERVSFFWDVLAPIYLLLSRYDIRPLQAALTTHGALLGKSFDWSFENKGNVNGTLELRVRKCFFWSLCKRIKTPYLMDIFCNADNIWNEKVDAQRHLMSYSRPSTMPSGKPACHFIWQKLDIGKPPLKVKLTKRKNDELPELIAHISSKTFRPQPAAEPILIPVPIEANKKKRKSEDVLKSQSENNGPQ